MMIERQQSAWGDPRLALLPPARRLPGDRCSPRLLWRSLAKRLPCVFQPCVAHAGACLSGRQVRSIGMSACCRRRRPPPPAAPPPAAVAWMAVAPQRHCLLLPQCCLRRPRRQPAPAACPAEQRCVQHVWHSWLNAVHAWAACRPEAYSCQTRSGAGSCAWLRGTLPPPAAASASPSAPRARGWPVPGGRGCAARYGGRRWKAE